MHRRKMRIDINKLLAGFVYSNIVVFITLFITPLVSYTISSKLYYEMNNKLSNSNDLVIPNMYNDNLQPYGSNTFEYSLKALPVANHLYGLPQLNMFFICESNLQNVQFIKIVESLDNKNVRTNVANVFCNKEFDYFTERKNSLNRNGIITRMMNYLTYPDFKEMKMETMDNVNHINVETDNSKYLTNANSVYSVQVDYLGSKSIKLLTNSNISFKYDINNEVLIKKIISKHPYLIKCCCFIGVYLSLLFVISFTFTFLYKLDSDNKKQQASARL